MPHPILWEGAKGRKRGGGGREELKRGEEGGRGGLNVESNEVKCVES